MADMALIPFTLNIDLMKSLVLPRHMAYSSSGEEWYMRLKTVSYIPSSSEGEDILLQTPPNSNVSLVEYRLIGGEFLCVLSLSRG
jgi:hypothetical protein